MVAYLVAGQGEGGVADSVLRVDEADTYQLIMPWNTNDAERPMAWWPGTQCVRCAYLRVDEADVSAHHALEYQ